MIGQRPSDVELDDVVVPVEPTLRLRFFLIALIAITVGFGAFYFFLAWTTNSPTSAALGMTLLAGTAIYVWALSESSQGRSAVAAGILVATMLFISPIFVVVAPASYASVFLGPLIAVVLAMPVIRGRRFTALTVLAWVDMGLIVLLGIVLDPAWASGATFDLTDATRATGFMVTGGLTLLLFHRVATKLVASLEASHDAQERLGASYVRLRQLDDLKTQFMNNSAHELNTPLTPIRLQMHLLKQEKELLENPKAREAVEVLERNVNRVTTLVREILDASRVRAGRLEPEMNPVMLEELVRQSVRSFREPARIAGVALEADVVGGMEVTGDERRLSQVLDNLILNAIKFTPRGGRIDVHVHPDGQGVRVEVRDTGVGFTAQEQDRIFEAFSQIDNPMQRHHHGAGLGLYIVRGIVEAHGGHVWAESPGPDLGSTFAFWIPGEGTAPKRSGDGAAADPFGRALVPADENQGSEPEPEPEMTEEEIRLRQLI